jgi:hypothetical protein
MKCNGCGVDNEKVWAVHPKKEKFTGRVFEECNLCFDSCIPARPDIYFREPYWDENLGDLDDPSYDPKRGTFIRSRSHKAYVLKKLGLIEDGDKRNGSRAYDPMYSKHALASLNQPRRSR